MPFHKSTILLKKQKLENISCRMTFHESGLHVAHRVGDDLNLMKENTAKYYCSIPLRHLKRNTSLKFPFCTQLPKETTYVIKMFRIS